MRNELVLPSVPNSSIHLGGLRIPRDEEDFCDWHLHDEFEVLWVRSGRKDFSVGEELYELSEGDIIFLGSRVPHEIVAYPGCTDFLVQFEGERYAADVWNHLARFLNTGGVEVRVFRSGEELHAQVLAVLQKLAEEWEAEHKAYERYVKAYVYQLIAILSRAGLIAELDPKIESEGAERILPVLRYLDEHYHEQIGLDDLCGMMNLNKSYFCRLFHKFTHTSVVQYLNFVRVCKAEQLLRKSEKSISQIAIECGFSSVAYFNRVFRKYRYCTPSFYRKIRH